MDFFEHPLFLSSFGLLGGIVGVLFYAPVLVLCGLCIVLAFHRAKVVAGRGITVKCASYLLLVSSVTGGLYWLHRAIPHKLIEGNTTVAELVVEYLKLRLVQQPPIATAPILSPTHAPPKKLQILGLVPVDVYIRRRITINGAGMDFQEHGILLLARVENSSEPSIITGIDLEGKLHLNSSELMDLSSALPSLKDLPWPLMDVLGYLAKKKPYRRISWKGWPTEKVPVQLHAHEERVIGFTLVEPGKAQDSFSIEGRGQLTEFVGYDDGTQVPKWVDRSPAPRVFFRDYFPIISNVPTKIKEDFTNGNVRTALRVNSSSLLISPSAFLPLKRATEDDWKRAAPDEIYYGQNSFFRYGDLTPYRKGRRKRPE